MNYLSGSKALDAACNQMMTAMLGILLHPSYDPTTIGPLLDKFAKRLSDEPIFKMLALFSLGPASERSILQEVENVLRAAWPLGFEEAKPAENASETPTNTDGVAAAYAIEHPYGDQGREFQEILATLEKNEGRELTLEEKLRTVRAFNKAVNEGLPQTVTFSGKDGYLVVGTKSLAGGLDALMANLDRALR